MESLVDIWRESTYQSITKSWIGLLKRKIGGNFNLEMPCIFAFLFLNQKKLAATSRNPICSPEMLWPSCCSPEAPWGQEPNILQMNWIPSLSLFFLFWFLLKSCPLPIFLSNVLSIIWNYMDNLLLWLELSFNQYCQSFLFLMIWLKTCSLLKFGRERPRDCPRIRNRKSPHCDIEVVVSLLLSVGHI